MGFNNGLSAAQPGLIEGLEIPQFKPFPIYKQLGGAAIPHIAPHSIALPHFAGDWNGPAKGTALAELQAAYAGASMVYGRDAARMVLEDPDPAGDAHVVTFTSDGEHIDTFANYCLETEGRVLYYHFPITSTPITVSYDDFRRARRQLRNLQDYAKEASEALRDELKDKWSSTRQDEAAALGADGKADGVGAPGDEAVAPERDPDRSSTQLLTRKRQRAGTRRWVKLKRRLLNDYLTLENHSTCTRQRAFNMCLFVCATLW